MIGANNRIEVLHGVNLDMLGKRDPEHYGTLTLVELEVRIRHWARELGLETTFFHTNSGEYVERLHQAPELADGLVLNPGAWTHYSYAIRDALEIAGSPAVEVHLSDVESREQWRAPLGDRGPRHRTVHGKGADGYRELSSCSRGSSASRRRRPHELARRAGRPPRGARSRRRELDLLVVSNLVNVRYLTGFSGTNAIVVIGNAPPAPSACSAPTSATTSAFARSSRTTSRRATADILDPRELSRTRREGGKLRVGFDDTHLTVRAHKRLAGLVGDAAELVPAGGLVEKLRAVKDPGEARRCAAHAKVAAELYSGCLRLRTRRAIPSARSRSASTSGGEGSVRTAFRFRRSSRPGANGALPHAEPGDAEIHADTLVIVDSAACRGLLLGLHAHVCDRRARPAGGGRLRACWRRRARASRRFAPGSAGATPTRSPAGSSTGRGTASGSATGSATGSAWRSTRARGCRARAKREARARQRVTVEPGVYVAGSLRGANRGPGRRDRRRLRDPHADLSKDLITV